MGKYIRENERYVIETMLKDGKKVKEIAERLGKHYNTIYNEIKRGTVLLRDSATWEDKSTYCADAGQRVQEVRSHNKGIDIKVIDFKYLKKASYYIKELHYSPYATIQALKSEFPNVTICRGTLYNYLYGGYLFNVEKTDLPYHKNTHDTAQKSRRPSLKLLGARTIEERPKSVYSRNLYGDWEIDTVVGAKGKGKECLLVLTERMTRQEIIRKIPNRQKESVVNALNLLEKEMGLQDFKRTFRTITCDNGVEFSDFNGIEKSIDGIHQRTTVYFCHAYCSGERGSNENNNKLIRRFIPKGSIIENFTHDFISNIEKWMNNYPRKIFGGMSSNQLLQLVTIP